MSEDQTRGRRRPSREYYAGEKEQSGSSRRKREEDIIEEPTAKVIKKEVERDDIPSGSRDSIAVPSERADREVVKREPDLDDTPSRSLGSVGAPSERAGREVAKTEPNPDSIPSGSRGGVRDPSERGGVRDPSERGGVREPSERGGVREPSERGGVREPSERGGVREPSERGGDEGQRRDRNTGYDLVCSRPHDLISKQGKSGTPIDLQSNYFRLLTTPTWRINQYHVDFEPPVENRRLRAGVLSEHRALFGGYIFDGTKLFCSNRLPDDKTKLSVTSKSGDQFIITLRFVGAIAMTDSQSLQVLNLILRRSMAGLKLQLVGRNFFDPQATIDLRDFCLQLWPGYDTSIRQHERAILLCAEIAHKVMRTETVYDILKKCIETSRDYKEDFRRQVLGLTVLTDYNNKTYRINDVDFAKTPRHTFSCKKNEVSFIDYYYEKYRIRIRDPKQPLLISKAKEKSVRGGANDIVILIPELCRATGLTDAMRTNFQLMRAMADHTRMNPDRRIERLRTFNQRLQGTPDSVKVLKDWNMSLDRNLVDVKGRVLDIQKIIFRDHRRVLAGENADWTREFRTNGMFVTPSNGLRHWSVIGTSRFSRDLRNFVDALIRAADGMQLRISRPKEVVLHDDRNHSFMQAMDDCAREDPQLILCLVPNNNAERYSSIKRKGCLERGIPTQVITQRTAGNQRGLMSVATKVAIQINCKLGYTPWIVHIPLPGLMTIGYDVAKSTRDRSKAFGALVATMDFQSNATFYSTVAECNSHDVLANHLWPMMTKALRQYMREHDDKLPTRILFYRDGVGEGSLAQVYEHEVKDIVEKLEIEYKRAGKEKAPMFAYIIVSKNVNTRFFARGRNPLPGTVVDDVVTLPERYDFFLVSQSVRQGTVSPTSYNVVYSTIKLEPDQVQLLTYKMTHLYYNWCGTTRVPAVCQYAKKLATLVASSLHQPPLNTLEKKLFYL